MAQIISVSIDLNKIDKNRIIPGKNGAKYYNITINVNDEKDQYGNDVNAITSQTQEERQAKAPKTYLGNGRVVWSNNANTQEVVQPTTQDFQANQVVNNENPDDLPF